jgi:hypothetical protein
MMWQMKAANLRASSPTDKAANDLATMLMLQVPSEAAGDND